MQIEIYQTATAPTSKALPPTVRPRGRRRSQPAALEEAGSVLIVDHDRSAIEELRAALAGYDDVRFATSAEDADRMLGERRADLILFDAEMPGMSGVDFCARLESDPTLRGIPVILLTSQEDVVFEARAIEHGAADILVKPVSPPRVQLRVRLHLRLERQTQQLQQLAVTDELTGLANRRAFDDALAREWAGAMRSGRALSLVVADIDFFQRYNDIYGHQEGDRCLQRIAGALRSAGRRRTDVVARIGGEELALLLPDTPAEGAAVVAKALTRDVAALELPHPASDVGPHVTVSVGVCTLPAGSGPELAASPEDLLFSANRALYLAKASGRARIVDAPLSRADR